MDKIKVRGILKIKKNERYKRYKFITKRLLYDQETLAMFITIKN